MTLGYVDSSCIAAVAFAEPGHGRVARRLARFERVYSSTLLEAEILSALRREGVTEEPALLNSISWVLPDRRLTQEISAVLAAGHLRGADLWHVACALYLSPDPTELSFVTLDESQAVVASAIGFPA